MLSMLIILLELDRVWPPTPRPTRRAELRTWIRYLDGRDCSVFEIERDR
jgi:hypothetical protein